MMINAYETVPERAPQMMSWRDKLLAAQDCYGYLFVCLPDVETAIEVERTASQPTNAWANYLHRRYLERLEHSEVDLLDDPFGDQLTYRPIGCAPEDDSADNVCYVQIDLDNIKHLLGKLPADLLDYRG